MFDSEAIEVSDSELDKRAHYAKLAGFIQEGDTGFINLNYFRFNKSFNLYKTNSWFYNAATKNTAVDHIVDSNEFTDWLQRVELVTKIERSAPTDAIYECYPFYPSPKDILWTVRVLKNDLELLTTNDIFLLALYREIQINGQDVEKCVITRNISEITEVLQDLNKLHQGCVYTYLTE